MKTYNKGNYTEENAIVTALKDWTGADKVRFRQSNHKRENGEWTDFICDVWICFFNNKPSETYFFATDKSNLSDIHFIVNTKNNVWYAEEVKI